MADRRDYIGVMDSGVGGVSVLRDMVKMLPKERFIYLGDTKNAPYGTKQEDEIRTLATDAVSILLKQGIKALVIACNTATSAAAQALRETLSIPVIGMEPALKPASEHTFEGKIAVLATPATLRQPKFQKLYAQYGQRALPVPCAGLMEFAERCELEGDGIDAYLAHLFAPYRGQIRAAVLGCTHYVFLKNAIQKALPEATLYDGNDGTARRLRQVLSENGLLSENGEGGVTFQTTGDAETALPLMRTLFSIPV